MKMTKIFQFALLCASVFVLTGCPYNSEIALSKAETKAPDYLIGNWGITESTTGDVTKVTRGTGNELKVERVNGDDGASTIYFGHITMINNEMFLNLAEKSDFGTTYYFYKIEKVSDTNFKLFSVTGNIREVFDNSEKLKAFFASNMQNSYFFDSGEESYSKIK